MRFFHLIASRVVRAWGKEKGLEVQLAGVLLIPDHTVAMKTILAPLLMAGSIQSLFAVEYVTLSSSTNSHTVATGATVEIVGHNSTSPQGNTLLFTLANGDNFAFAVKSYSAVTGVSHSNILGNKFTNVTAVSLNGSWGGNVVTLKITSAAEISSAGPTSVLVIPEGSEGEFDIIIESSSDMVTWTPMHSQTVVGNAPTKLFRTRIVKKSDAGWSDQI